MNRKGYVLVEIVLASVIAFGIAYFIIDLTIKLKNKNDDLLVETLVETDRAIIANKIMSHIYTDNDIDCSKLSIQDKVISYDGELIDIANEYVTIGNKVCTKASNIIEITIPLSVNQMPDKNFDVELFYVIKN